MCPLLDSEIFRYRLTFEEWPASHPDDTEITRPYNGPIFDLRLFYRKIFSEEEFEIPETEDFAAANLAAQQMKHLSLKER